jgi:hypothetical protein
MRLVVRNITTRGTRSRKPEAALPVFSTRYGLTTSYSFQRKRLSPLVNFDYLVCAWRKGFIVTTLLQN